MRFFAHFGLALLLPLMLCACGHKGPLYLRDNPPPGVKPTTSRIGLTG